MPSRNSFRYWELAKQYHCTVEELVAVLNRHKPEKQKLPTVLLRFMPVSAEDLLLIRKHMKSELSSDTPKSVEHEQASDAPEGVETAQASETPETVDNAQASEAQETVDNAQASEAQETVETAQASDVPEGVETAPMSDVLETVETAQVSDTPETVDNAQASDAPEIVTDAQQTAPANYAEYCRALQDGDPAAKLVHYVRTWFIDLTRSERETEKALSLDAFHAPPVPTLTQDALSRILADCKGAFSHIIGAMREKIVRENVMTPIQKAREIDSAGIRWLCRRPGGSLREKLSGTRSLLAVRRRMSLDTGENRLLLAFSRRASDMIHEKLNSVPEKIGVLTEREFLHAADTLEACEGIEEVRAWRNIPPNNVLLSDRYYRQIWNAWNALNALDELTAADFQKLPERLTTILYAEIVSILKSAVRFPQQPVAVDYLSCRFRLPASETSGADSNGQTLCGLDSDGRSLVVEKRSDGVRILYGVRAVSAEVRGTVLYVKNEDATETVEEAKPITVETLPELARELCAAVGVRTDGTRCAEQVSAPRYNQTVIDLFRVRPLVSHDGDAPASAPWRLLGQSQTYASETYTLSCAASQAFALPDTDSTGVYSIVSAVRNNARADIAHLTEILRKRLDSRFLLGVFPDCYNEFELRNLRASLRVHYRKVETLPQSIAAAFYCAQDPAWIESLKDGELVLVADFSFPQCALTLLRAQHAPDSGGVLMWERYPSETFSLDAQSDDKARKLERLCALLEQRGLCLPEEWLSIFGVDGLSDAAGQMALLYGNKTWFSIEQDVNALLDGLRLNITPQIRSFYKKMKSVLGKCNPHVLLLSPQIVCDAELSCRRLERAHIIEGCQIYQTESRRYGGVTLWRDHLPNLSIKRLVGEFSLVKDAVPVRPVYHKAVVIPIENTFTLPKGQQSYRFQLIQANAGTRIQYAAVVENRAFPLREDVECRLHMSYCYGSDDPYALAFEPLHPEQAGFRRANVKWTTIERIPCDNLPYPDFPKGETWEQLRHMPNKKHPEHGTRDIVAKLTQNLNKITNEMELPRAEFSLVVPLTPQDWPQTIRPAPQTYERPAIALARTESGLVRLRLWRSRFDNREETLGSIQEITCSIQVDSKQPTETIRLSDYDQEWKTNQKGELYCFVIRRVDNETQSISFHQNSVLNGAFSPESDWISFSLKEIQKTFETVSGSEFPWRWPRDKRGNQYFYLTMRLRNGAEKEIAFYENEFLFPEDFPPSPEDLLSFRVRENSKTGKCTAKEIIIGDRKSYLAQNIVSGRIHACYSAHNARLGLHKPGFSSITKNNALFLLHIIFGRGSLSETDCPEELQEAIKRVIPILSKAYYDRSLSGNKRQVSHATFAMLSMLASYVGEAYDRIAEEAVKSWLCGEHVEDEIGYALSVISGQRREHLLRLVLQLPMDSIVCIFARAAWRSENFILEIQPDVSLSLVQSAADLLTSLYLREEIGKCSEKARGQGISKHTGRYIEFLLAAFRLRSLHDEGINQKLSLNNPVMERLYRCAEAMYAQKVNIKTFLAFDEKQPRKGIASDMNLILYLLLVYITGESGENEIVISGVEVEEPEASDF